MGKPKHTKFDIKNIKITKRIIYLSEIINKFKKNEICCDSKYATNEYCWNVIDASRFIESIILEFPLSNFYFDTTINNWTVIDGRQRLLAVRDFVNQTFSLKNMEFLTEFTNYRFNDLNRIIQRIIENTQIHTYHIEPPTSKVFIRSILNRINMNTSIKRLVLPHIIISSFMPDHKKAEGRRAFGS